MTNTNGPGRPCVVMTKNVRMPNATRRHCASSFAASAAYSALFEQSPDCRYCNFVVRPASETPRSSASTPSITVERTSVSANSFHRGARTGFVCADQAQLRGRFQKYLWLVIAHLVDLVGGDFFMLLFANDNAAQFVAAHLHCLRSSCLRSSCAADRITDRRNFLTSDALTSDRREFAGETQEKQKTKKRPLPADHSRSVCLASDGIVMTLSSVNENRMAMRPYPIHHRTANTMGSDRTVLSPRVSCGLSPAVRVPRATGGSRYVQSCGDGENTGIALLHLNRANQQTMSPATHYGGFFAP